MANFLIGYGTGDGQSLTEEFLRECTREDVRGRG